MEADLQRETEQQKGNANEAEEWGRGESDAPHQLLQAGASRCGRRLSLTGMILFFKVAVILTN